MIYLDTSALTKLLIDEPETPALRTWLAERLKPGDSAATSVIGRIELLRVIVRQGDSEHMERARFLLEGLDLLPLSDAVVALAETIGPSTLRSLDAIHLAAAKQIERELSAFVTYDHRLLEGCGQVGLPAVAPGSGGR